MVRQKSLFGIAGVAVILLGLVSGIVIPGHANASTQITNRSLTLEAGAIDGGSKPGGTVKHLFTFDLHDIAGADKLGSISFQYCTTAAAVPSGIGCIMPTGLNVSGANLNAQTGATGFTSTTTSSECDGTPCTDTNVVTIGRSTAANILSDPTSVSYEFTGIVNPSDAETFFVRISTYTSLDGSGTALESGTVAAATSTQINLSGTMPESLVFCAGAAVGLTSGVPDCSTVTTGNVAFDRLFSPTDTALATSQMAASTNAGQGYVITINGPTLTSGGNTINAMTLADTSKHGVSQFGLNLVLNDGTAYVGAPNLSNMSVAGEPNSADIDPSSGTGSYNGIAATGYDGGSAHNGTFQFNSGDAVANSGYGGSPIGSDAQIYTASYIVNVPGSQPAGTYSTTLTYICTPTF